MSLPLIVFILPKLKKNTHSPRKMCKKLGYSPRKVYHFVNYSPRKVLQHEKTTISMTWSSRGPNMRKNWKISVFSEFFNKKIYVFSEFFNKKIYVRLFRGFILFVRFGTREGQIQKSRLVLTDEPASFAYKFYYTYTLAHNGLKVGAKITIIWSISKKKLKKTIFSSK